MTGGLYVYAVVAGKPAELGTGIDGAALEVVAGPGDLAAVVHRHAAGPYEGADDDVRRWVVEHSDVVERVWESTGAVLPMSFNVIVAEGEETPARSRLEGWLTAGGRLLRERLDALENRVELRVEIGLDQHRVAERHPDVVAMREDLETRPPGVRRLLGKRLDQLEREVTDALADDLYQQYRRRLAAVSEELSENRSARPGEGVVPVLTVSLLVPRDAIPAVGQELAAVQDEEPAAVIRYLGPWPPYSFADVPGLAGPTPT
ncbi:GvpL/GvpF family gas vesicle protein [Georgenia sp. SUBG003]|uniref:GvpL/GvpF family gas vesicle protein n=1 Tax=Georgenia sp. SUBG003 TaxID=1497974 RepID=UPI0004D43D6C|nr:hypothetical protein DA06_06560 [Georgenia sp. SUBG003]